MNPPVGFGYIETWRLTCICGESLEITNNMTDGTRATSPFAYNFYARLERDWRSRHDGDKCAASMERVG